VVVNDEVGRAPAEGKEKMGEAAVDAGEDVMINDCRSGVC